MIAQRSGAIFCVLICLFVHACAEVPHRSTRDSSVTNTEVVRIAQQRVVLARQQMALQYEQAGDYRLALREWEIILSIDPHHQQAHSQHQSLRATIDGKIKVLTDAGDKAFRSGRYRVAQRKWLAALALDPTRSSYFTKLRDIHAKQQQKIQLAKLKKLQKVQSVAQSADVNSGEEQYYLRQNNFDKPAPVAAYKNDHVDAAHDELHVSAAKATVVVTAQEHDPEKVQKHLRLAEKYLSKKELLLALEHFEKAQSLSDQQDVDLQRQVAVLKKDLADQLYSAGVRIYAQDIHEAIGHWEKSIFYNAQHYKAKHRLLNAYKVQQKLERLEAISRTQKQ